MCRCRDVDGLFEHVLSLESDGKFTQFGQTLKDDLFWQVGQVEVDRLTVFPDTASLTYLFHNSTADNVT